METRLWLIISLMTQLFIVNGLPCQTSNPTAFMCHTGSAHGPAVTLDVSSASDGNFTSCACAITTNITGFSVSFDATPVSQTNCSTTLVLTFSDQMMQLKCGSPLGPQTTKGRTASIQYSVIDPLGPIDSSYCLTFYNNDTNIDIVLTCESPPPDTTSTTSTPTTFTASNITTNTTSTTTPFAAANTSANTTTITPGITNSNTTVSSQVTMSDTGSNATTPTLTTTITPDSNNTLYNTTLQNPSATTVASVTASSTTVSRINTTTALPINNTTPIDNSSTVSNTNVTTSSPDSTTSAGGLHSTSPSSNITTDSPVLNVTSTSTTPPTSLPTTLNISNTTQPNSPTQITSTNSTNSSPTSVIPKTSVTFSPNTTMSSRSVSNITSTVSLTSTIKSPFNTTVHSSTFSSTGSTSVPLNNTSQSPNTTDTLTTSPAPLTTTTANPLDNTTASITSSTTSGLTGNITIGDNATTNDPLNFTTGTNHSTTAFYSITTPVLTNDTATANSTVTSPSDSNTTTTSFTTTTEPTNATTYDVNGTTTTESYNFTTTTDFNDNSTINVTDSVVLPTTKRPTTTNGFWVPPEKDYDTPEKTNNVVVILVPLVAVLLVAFVAVVTFVMCKRSRKAMQRTRVPDAEKNKPSKTDNNGNVNGAGYKALNGTQPAKKPDNPIDNFIIANDSKCTTNVNEDNRIHEQNHHRYTKAQHRTKGNTSMSDSHVSGESNMDSSLLVNGTSGPPKVYEPSEREKDLLENLELSSIVIENDPNDPNRYFTKTDPGDWYRKVIKGKDTKKKSSKSKKRSNKKKASSKDKGWHSDGDDDSSKKRRRSRSSRYNTCDNEMLSSDISHSRRARKNHSETKHSRARPQSADLSRRQRHSSYDRKLSSTIDTSETTLSMDSRGRRDSNHSRSRSRPSSGSKQRSRKYEDSSDEDNYQHRQRSLVNQPKVIESKPTVVESKPKIVESKPKVVESKPRVVESSPKVVHSQSRIIESEPKVVESKPQQSNVLFSQPSVKKPPVNVNSQEIGSTVQDIVRQVNEPGNVSQASLSSSQTQSIAITTPMRSNTPTNIQASPARQRSSIFGQKSYNKPSTEGAASSVQDGASKRPESVPRLNLTNTGDQVEIDDDGFEGFVLNN